MSTEKTDRAREIRMLLDRERRKPGHYQDMQRLLNRYALERFLYRLSVSEYRGKFILKGALLLALYIPDEYRATRDGDLLAFGYYTNADLRLIMQKLCAIEHDDGLIFDAAKIGIEEAGADREYPGFVVMIPARLNESNCNLHLDIGFGQAITPNPIVVEYPSLLNLPKPRLSVYPIETIVAEKFHAIVHLGLSNARLKDFHDLAQIARHRALSGEIVQQAITATFDRRNTPVPFETPIGLSLAFFDSDDRRKYWRAFLRRHGLSKNQSLQKICQEVEAFVMPVARACAENRDFTSIWQDGTWHTEPPKEASS